jgi:opacity protein-like surface antigen
MKNTLLAVCFIGALQNLSGAWSFETGILTSYGYQIDESRKDWHEEGVAKPPYIKLGPLWPAEAYTFASVVDGKASGGFVGGQYSHTFGNWTVAIPLNVSVERESVTYYIEYYNYFPGLNPFTMGFGGPPVLVGAGNLEVKSAKITPEVGLRTGYQWTPKFSTWVSLMYGISYVTYSDYPLYNLVYQRTEPFSLYERLTRTTPSSDQIKRWNLGIGMAYDISPSWSIALEQRYVRIKSFYLRNEVDVNSSHTYFGLSIDAMHFWQTSLGVKYRF